MKSNLDFNTEIPHHSEDQDAVLNVSITTYSDGPVMSVSGDPKLKAFSSISLNRTELESLLAILDRYDEAQKIMEGKAP